MATIDVIDPAREGLNQAPPLQPIDFFEVDRALREALERERGEGGRVYGTLPLGVDARAIVERAYPV